MDKEFLSKKIKQYQERRAILLEQANRQIAVLDGAIAACEEMLKEISEVTEVASDMPETTETAIS